MTENKQDGGDDLRSEAFVSVLSSIDTEGTGKLSGGDLLEALEEVGILEDDIRLVGSIRALKNAGGMRKQHSIEALASIVREDSVLISQALSGQLTVPGWQEFCAILREIYVDVEKNEGGNVATYIPALAKVDPNQFAVSVCTISGQRFNMGDSGVQFGVQSCSKPISYLTAMNDLGAERVHRHVGREPSGRSFNEMCLKEVPESDRVNENRTHVPHNPMINAGAIMSCSLIQIGQPLGERLEHCMNVYNRLCGSAVSFSGSMFLGERETADRNFCLGYMMRESGSFTEGSNLQQDLELYFQTCSILVTCEQMAQLGATLANGGTNPISEDIIFPPENTKKCLSLMLSCGMYDFSGEWAFSVGLPAKSGVGGCVYVVIPNFGGLAIWSPRLDSIGNSVRSVQFTIELLKRFRFHQYDTLAGLADGREDPRRVPGSGSQDVMVALLFAAADGNMHTMKALIAGGADVNIKDYDGRTALHLAASEGHGEVVAYLLAHGAHHSPLDRWNGTPLADAIRHEYEAVAQLLRDAGAA